MPNSHRLSYRRGHDPWWNAEGRTVRRHRRLKAAVDFAILAVAILTLAVVFGSRPVIGI